MITIGLKVKIITAVLSLTMIVNLAVTYYLIENEKVDAQIINIAGKQRMLTQKMIGEFYRLGVNPIEAKPELKKVHDAFTYNLNRLLAGDLSYEKSQSIHESLIAIDSKWLAFDALIVEKSDKDIALNSKLIYKEGNKLFGVIDEMVLSYEKQATEKRDFINTVQLLLGFITLIIIIYMAIVALGINTQLSAFLKHSSSISGRSQAEDGNELEAACMHIQYFLDDVETAIDSASKAVRQSEKAALHLAMSKEKPEALDQLDKSEDIVIEANEELYKTAMLLKKLKQKLQNSTEISF